MTVRGERLTGRVTVRVRATTVELDSCTAKVATVPMVTLTICTSTLLSTPLRLGRMTWP